MEKKLRRIKMSSIRLLKKYVSRKKVLFYFWIIELFFNVMQSKNIKKAELAKDSTVFDPHKNLKMGSQRRKMIQVILNQKTMNHVL